jgi:hypothetical protein
LKLELTDKTTEKEIIKKMYKIAHQKVKAGDSGEPSAFQNILFPKFSDFATNEMSVSSKTVDQFHNYFETGREVPSASLWNHELRSRRRIP